MRAATRLRIFGPLKLENREVTRRKKAFRYKAWVQFAKRSATMWAGS